MHALTHTRTHTHTHTHTHTEHIDVMSTFQERIRQGNSDTTIFQADIFAHRVSVLVDLQWCILFAHDRESFKKLQSCTRKLEYLQR